MIVRVYDTETGSSNIEGLTIKVDGLTIEKKEGNTNYLNPEVGDVLKSGWLNDDSVSPVALNASYASYGVYNGGTPIKNLSSWGDYISRVDL
ncbi:hypothetical protein [Aquimarina sp. 2201CG5-10]|uniref:hypothetical protein n=1 Tax=Aquimarina callyspongiae TaxID=3098150 RepID=UPI002AB436A0|nr:hypothetical protein [Aquimarina sp. 2201CG5-10]MDY8137554.1 hypothetical protein [Aquimarina sp. 2201CG5-10]